MANQNGDSEFNEHSVLKASEAVEGKQQPVGHTWIRSSLPIGHGESGPASIAANQEA